MQLSVKGKQLDVGDALRSHVAENLPLIVEKYFNRPIEANVVFSRDAHLFRADISVHAGRGILLQSNASADGPYAAFDLAAEKIAKRLRRYKRRLRDHHNGDAGEVLPARKYILEAEPEDAHLAEPDENGPEDEFKPVIIAEMQTHIETLTVGEAVMRMELAELPALMFRNRGTGGFNMVYRRPDGNVGWVDPANAAEGRG